MSGEDDFEDEELEEESDGDDEEVTEADDDSDSIGDMDMSVEINVEDLLVQLEREARSLGTSGSLSARRKLEEIMEQRRARAELEDFEDYRFD